MMVKFPTWKNYYHPVNCPVCTADGKYQVVHVHSETCPPNDYKTGWDDGRKWGARRAQGIVARMKGLTKEKLYDILEKLETDDDAGRD